MIITINIDTDNLSPLDQRILSKLLPAPDETGAEAPKAE